MGDDGHVHMIQALDLTPDGQTAVTADGATVRLWDTRTGKEKRRLDVANSVTALALSFDGRTLVTNLYGSKTVVLWDMETGKELRRIAVKEDPVRVGFSPDARTVVATAFNNLTVHFFDAETGKETRVIVGNANELSMGLSPLPFRFAPDGRFFASLFRSHEHGSGIGFWDLSKKDAKLPAQVVDTGYVWDFALSPDGEYLAWAGQDHTRVWDLRARKPLPIAAAPGRIVFTPDGRYLIAGAKLVPLDPKTAALELPVTPGWIACSRDSSIVVVVPQNDCTALVLDARKLGK
jgi:WD40 repeat protein